MSKSEMYFFKSSKNKLIIELTFNDSPIVRVKENETDRDTDKTFTVALFTCESSSGQSRRRSTECTIRYKPKIEKHYLSSGNVKRLTGFYEDLNKTEEKRRSFEIYDKVTGNTVSDFLTEVKEQKLKDPKIKEAFSTICDVLNSPDSASCSLEFNFDQEIVPQPLDVKDLTAKCSTVTSDIGDEFKTSSEGLSKMENELPSFLKGSTRPVKIIEYEITPMSPADFINKAMKYEEDHRKSPNIEEAFSGICEDFISSDSEGSSEQFNFDQEIIPPPLDVEDCDDN